MESPRDASAGYMMPDPTPEQRALRESQDASRARDERNRTNRPAPKPSLWQRIKGWFA